MSARKSKRPQADQKGRRPRRALRLPDQVVAKMYEAHLAGATLKEIAQATGREVSTVYRLFHVRGLKLQPRTWKMPKRVSDDWIRAMHAEYMAGATFAELGRRHHRTRASIRHLFTSRGLEVREHHDTPTVRRGPLGFLPLIPKTDSELEQLIARATKIAVPLELRAEWRHWPLERRGQFIARIRARIASRDDRPSTPFSSNVIPFDYGTPAAWAIAARVNAGLDSRHWIARILPSSQGVIWDERLWFWSPKAGYVLGCKWTEEFSRPLLHVTIWERATGRTLPPHHVIRQRDRNWNNLAPENLLLESREQLLRENQAASLLAKSRAFTGALLSRTQKKGTSHGLLEVLQPA